MMLSTVPTPPTNAALKVGCDRAGMPWLRVVCWALAALAGLMVPALFDSAFYLGLLINAIVLGIAALSIGFLAHQCGLIMFGVAGFTGGCGYLFAIAIGQFGWPLLPAAAFALAAATTCALLIGMLIIRARPLPFAMMTLALAQMLREVVNITSLRPITGGDDGLVLDFSGRLFGLSAQMLTTPHTFWPLAWLALCVTLLLAWMVGRSRLGLVLRMIKTNEQRMRFSGFSTYWPRVFAFALAGFMASVSGLLTALNTAFVSPELLDFITGGNALVSMLVGGASSVIGPVVGALLYVIGQDQFGASGHLELFTGLAVVTVIIGLPGGVVGNANRMCSHLLVQLRKRSRNVAR